MLLFFFNIIIIIKKILIIVLNTSLKHYFGTQLEKNYELSNTFNRSKKVYIYNIRGIYLV